VNDAGPTEGREYHLDGLQPAPWLVLLGSLGTTTAVWDRQVPALRDWFRVLRIEHPGHGGAGLPGGQGTVEALGQRIVATLDRLGIDRAHVAGLSLGGLVGIWLASNHPGRVDRLVLACTAGRFNAAESYRQRAAAVRAQGTRQLVPASLSRWFTGPFASRFPDVTAQYAAMLAGVGPEGYAFCCEAVAEADLVPDLARIAARALVVGGALDPVIPPDLAAATMSAIPGATLCVLAGGAHLVNVEQPEAFNEVLLRHLIGSASERGLEERRAVLGEAHVDRALARASELTGDFQELLAKWPWGEVWARPGLDRRARRLITIAMLVALGRSEELEMHIRQALRDGVSVNELKEVLLQTAVYAGVPAANSAFAIADRVVAVGEVPET
jgi:3-oxoadipate enol-lactonase / 4-carboxymuconolactone decarboxylase